jgi:hypothetical protein
VTSVGHRLELAHSAANDAIRGIAMQNYRLVSELPEDEEFFAAAGFRREVDLQLFLVLVARLRRMAGLIADLTSDELFAQDLAEFDQRFPAARHMRNVSEHLEDYIAGTGRRQDLVCDGSLGVRSWNTSADGGIVFAWAGKTVDLGDLQEAAENLYRSLRHAVKH